MSESVTKPAPAKNRILAIIEGRLSQASLICLILFTGLVLCMFALWARSTLHIYQPGVLQPATPTTPSAIAPPSAADYQKILDSFKKQIDSTFEEEKKLFDGVQLLVSIYAIIASLLAFASIKFARDEAREQLDLVRVRLEKVTLEADKKLKEIDERVKSHFPEFRYLHERLRAITLRLLGALPDENDWQASAYERLTETQRQDILVSEYTLAVIAVLGLSSSDEDTRTLTDLYLAFARFYTGRASAAKAPKSEPEAASEIRSPKADWERAFAYSNRAVQVRGDRADAYRVRGSCLLGRWWHAPDDNSVVMSRLLVEAESDYRISQRLNQYEAGSYFNLAICLFLRDDYEGAIAQLERLIGMRVDISSGEREKYMLDSYVNLACCYARRADTLLDADAAHIDREQAVKILKEGEFEARAAAYSASARAKTRNQIRKEVEKDDLRTLEPLQKEEALRIASQM
jgi:hypothetical protein